MSVFGTITAPDRVMLTTDTVGGVWQYTLELAAGCSAAGAAVEIVSMGPPPDDERRREVGRMDGVRLRHVDVPLDWMADGEEALREAADGLSCFASSFAPDLIHLSGASLAAFDWPAPVVATMHSCLPTWWAAMRTGPLPPEWQWHSAATIRGLAAADRVIAPSASYARALESTYGSLPGLRVIHNGRRNPVVPSATKKPIAVAAGRFWDEAKGLATLDAAAGRMKSPLVLAGALEGPQGQACTVRNARSCGSLPETELHALMAESAVFVSMSRYEPFGLGVLEAAQRHCALVLSDIDTFRELWDGAAVFVPPDDPEAVAAAVDRLTDSSIEAARFGVLARERARRYSAGRMVATTLGVYREALAATRPAVALGA